MIWDRDSENIGGVSIAVEEAHIQEGYFLHLEVTKNVATDLFESAYICDSVCSLCLCEYVCLCV